MTDIDCVKVACKKNCLPLELNGMTFEEYKDVMYLKNQTGESGIASLSFSEWRDLYQRQKNLNNSFKNNNSVVLQKIALSCPPEFILSDMVNIICKKNATISATNIQLLFYILSARNISPSLVDTITDYFENNTLTCGTKHNDVVYSFICPTAFSTSYNEVRNNMSSYVIDKLADKFLSIYNTHTFSNIPDIIVDLLHDIKDGSFAQIILNKYGHFEKVNQCIVENTNLPVSVRKTAFYNGCSIQSLDFKRIDNEELKDEIYQITISSIFDQYINLENISEHNRKFGSTFNNAEVGFSIGCATLTTLLNSDFLTVSKQNDLYFRLLNVKNPSIAKSDFLTDLMRETKSITILTDVENQSSSLAKILYANDVIFKDDICKEFAFKKCEDTAEKLIDKKDNKINLDNIKDNKIVAYLELFKNAVKHDEGNLSQKFYEVLYAVATDFKPYLFKTLATSSCIPESILEKVIDSCRNGLSNYEIDEYLDGYITSKINKYIRFENPDEFKNISNDNLKQYFNFIEATHYMTKCGIAKNVVLETNDFSSPDTCFDNIININKKLSSVFERIVDEETNSLIVVKNKIKQISHYVSFIEEIKNDYLKADLNKLKKITGNQIKDIQLFFTWYFNTVEALYAKNSIKKDIVISPLYLCENLSDRLRKVEFACKKISNMKFKENMREKIQQPTAYNER